MKRTRRRTKSEVQAILTQLDESKLSIPAFSNLKGIPKQSLYTWRQNAKKKDASKSAIVEVASFQRPESSNEKILLEFKGLKIHLPLSIDSSQWQAIREGLLLP